MTTERIKEIQKQTAYPDSISVQQALLQVWNECSQLPKQETFGSKGSDKHKEKLKELYPDAYSILGEVLYKKCKFEPTTNTSSATICKHCGREKLLHKT